MKNKFSFIYCNNMYKFNVLWIYLNICKANLLDFTLTMVCIVTNHIFIIMFHGTCCMLYAVCCMIVSFEHHHHNSMPQTGG